MLTKMSDEYNEYSYSSISLSGFVSKEYNFASPFVFNNLFAKVRERHHRTCFKSVFFHK